MSNESFQKLYEKYIKKHNGFILFLTKNYLDFLEINPQDRIYILSLLWKHTLNKGEYLINENALSEDGKMELFFMYEELVKSLNKDISEFKQIEDKLYKKGYKYFKQTYKPLLKGLMTEKKKEIFQEIWKCNYNRKYYRRMEKLKTLDPVLFLEKEKEHNEYFW